MTRRNASRSRKSSPIHGLRVLPQLLPKLKRRPFLPPALPSLCLQAHHNLSLDLLLSCQTLRVTFHHLLRLPPKQASTLLLHIMSHLPIKLLLPCLCSHPNPNRCYEVNPLMDRLLWQERRTRVSRATRVKRLLSSGRVRSTMRRILQNQHRGGRNPSRRAREKAMARRYPRPASMTSSQCQGCSLTLVMLHPPKCLFQVPP